MILSTASSLEGKKTVKYLGLVSGDAILGANIFSGFLRLGASSSMLMVSVSGTAVVVEPE